MTAKLKLITATHRPVDITARCRHGHPATPENSYCDASGNRIGCAVCRRAAVRRYRERNGVCYGERDARPFEERFWDKVAKRGPGECWLWTGSFFQTGYGQVCRDGKNFPAHRIAWELANGESLGNRWCLHSCDNRPCVNPAHLRPGDASDNMADASERCRFPNQHLTHCRQGHEYTPENTIRLARPNNRSARACKICRYAASRAWKSRNNQRST